ncbi:hypothetical protein V0U79_07630 [Hyphobacterium sp. HN65]|uniref:Transcriptional coactivator p15 (PC4) C-terminal domain-containing protein n=1 Tax=Hyphobacterium lacteum TaxID=3116575 RepID=A0ABU7LQQ6_9PROT|nr:hypothetical protein [Hyphobacterium sp. HN65]MEE2526233.1 hypothetical protein [Hyphobacterium sp. HN65]
MKVRSKSRIGRVCLSGRVFVEVHVRPGSIGTIELITFQHTPDGAASYAPLRMTTRDVESLTRLLHRASEIGAFADEQRRET